MKSVNTLFGVVFVLLVVQCARHPQVVETKDSVTRLKRELDYYFSDPSFTNAHWGVAIQSLKTGELLYLRNEHKGFMPASNMKLFTTAGALITLAEDYRFVTRLFATEPVDSTGVLRGDLVIVGTGDPSLCERFSNGRITHVFEQWADSLKNRGVRLIEGRIIGDDNYLKDELLGEGWSWDYLSDYYAAQISALTFNDNCIDIIFTPGDSIGAPASFILEPKTDYVDITNNVLTGDSTSIYFDRALGTNRVVCRGTIGRAEEKVRDWFTVENPTKYTTVVFREILIKHGIHVSGDAYDIDELDSYQYQDQSRYQVASHISPPLQEIVAAVNKKSQNLYAELLFRVVGKELGSDGSTSDGVKALKEIVTGMGINPETVSFADGSGLSRLDLITPMSVVKLLSYMHKQKTGSSFYASLPIAGVDGTIKSRMIGTRAEGNVRAKTGYIGRVRALSGYVTSADGELLAFSMIVNNYTVPTSLANHIQDAVCERLANFRRD